MPALHLKEMNPQMDVYILYRDIRTYGEKERLYQQAREKGVVFIRYSVNNKPDVIREKDGLSVTVTDHVLRQPVRIPAGLAGVSRFQYPANMRIIRVPCSGRVSAKMILHAIRSGADGVWISGCHPGDCHYIEGNFYARPDGSSKYHIGPGQGSQKIHC